MANPKATPGKTTDHNPRLKDRLTDEGTPMGRLEELNLSEAQKSKLQELRTSHHKQMNTLDAEIKNLELDLKQAVERDDYATAKRLNQQLHEKKASKSNAHLSHMEAVMKELDPQQREQYREAFQHTMGPRRGCMGSRMDKEPGLMRGDRSNPMQVYRHLRQMKQMRDCDDCDNCDQHKSAKPETSKPKTNQPK